MQTKPFTIVGACIFATRRGLTVSGVGCLSNNENMVLKGRLDRLRHADDPPGAVWFSIPGRSGDDHVRIIGLGGPSRDFTARDGVEGVAVAMVIGEEGMADYKRAVDLVYALQEINQSHLSKQHLEGFEYPAGATPIPHGREGRGFAFTSKQQRPARRFLLPENWQGVAAREEVFEFCSGEFADDGYVLFENPASVERRLTAEEIRDWHRDASQRAQARERARREASRSVAVAATPNDADANDADANDEVFSGGAGSAAWSERAAEPRKGRLEHHGAPPDRPDLYALLEQHHRRIAMLERGGLVALTVVMAIAVAAFFFAVNSLQRNTAENEGAAEAEATLREKQIVETMSPPPLPDPEVSGAPQATVSGIEMASGVRPFLDTPECAGLPELQRNLDGLQICEEMNATSASDPHYEQVRLECTDALERAHESLAVVKKCTSEINSCDPRDFGIPKRKAYRAPEWSRVRDRLECLRQ